jgi:hypothetical protein
LKASLTKTCNERNIFEPNKDEIKERGRQARHIASMKHEIFFCSFWIHMSYWLTRNMYINLVGKSLYKRLLTRPRDSKTIVLKLSYRNTLCRNEVDWKWLWTIPDDQLL